MSNLQNSLSNIFDTITESNVDLPQWINIVDIKKEENTKTEPSVFMKQEGGTKKSNKAIDSATSSAFVGQFGGNADSATSSAFIGQYGGHADSATSSAFIGQYGGHADSATSSAFVGQYGGHADSATSSAFVGQFGGNADSATSSAFIGQYGGRVDSATSSAFVGQQGGRVDSATSSAFVGQQGGRVDSATSAFIGQQAGRVDSATSSAFVGQQGKNIESVTSSAFIGQQDKNIDSATSSAFIGQQGGSKSKKQNGGTNADINKLVSMITSDGNNNINSETTTETLEAQLREILKQDGGSKKNKIAKTHETQQKTEQKAGSTTEQKTEQKAGSTTEQKAGNGGSTNVADIRNFFLNLKSQGVDVNVKLNDKTLSEFFDLAQNTTTEMSDHKLNNITGGAKNIQKKNPKKSNKIDLIDGGANPGFQAFLDFKKHVANKLKISNGPSAAKIAGSVNTSMKEKHSDLSSLEIAKKNTEYFDKNIDKIKSEFKELIEKNPIKK